MEKIRVGGGLIESHFEHQQGINVFFTGEKFKNYWEANKFIYQSSIVEGCAGDYFEPLSFFNILYDQVDVLERYYLEPLTVIEHLRSLELDEDSLYILLIAMSNLATAFNIQIPEDEYEERTDAVSDAIDTFFFLLRGEIQSLRKRLGVEEATIYDFNQLKPVLNSCKTPSEKIKCLLERKSMLQQELAKSTDKALIASGDAFIKACEIEIELVKRLQAEGSYDSIHQKLDIPKVSVSKEQSKRPKQAVLALFYYYLQETGEFPHFENIEGGKQRAIKKEAEKYGISGKRLEVLYNKIASSRSNRVAFNQVKNLDEVINMLEPYPKARSLAMDELELAKLARE